MGYSILESSFWAQDWERKAQDLATYLVIAAEKDAHYISIVGNEALLINGRSLDFSVEKVESFIKRFIQERPQGVSPAVLEELSGALGQFHQKVDKKLTVWGKIKYAFVRNVGTQALEKAIKEEKKVIRQESTKVSYAESRFFSQDDQEVLWHRVVKELETALLGVAEKENYYIRISREIETNRVMISGGGNPSLASSVQEVESLILDLITNKPKGVSREELQGLSDALAKFHEKVTRKSGLLQRINYVFVNNVGTLALEKTLKEQEASKVSGSFEDRSLPGSRYVPDYLRESNEERSSLFEPDYGDSLKLDDNAVTSEFSFGIKRGEEPSGENSNVGVEGSGGGFLQKVADRFFGRKKQSKAELLKKDPFSFSPISSGSSISAPGKDSLPYGYQEYQELLALLEQDDFKDTIEGCIEMAENMDSSCIKGEMLLAIEKRLEQLQIATLSDTIKLGNLIATNEKELNSEEAPFQDLLNVCLQLVEEGKEEEAINRLKDSTLSPIVKDARLRLVSQGLVSKGEFDLAIQASQAMTTPMVKARAILDICDGAIGVFTDISLERFSALLESIPREVTETCQDRYTKTWDGLRSLLEKTYSAAYGEVLEMVKLAKSDHDFTTCVESAKLLSIKEIKEKAFIEICQRLIACERLGKALEVTDLISDKGKADVLRNKVVERSKSIFREIVRKGDFEGAIAKVQEVLRAWSSSYQKREDLALELAMILIEEGDKRNGGIELSQIKEVIDGLFTLDIEESLIKEVRQMGIQLISMELCKLGKFSLALTVAQNLPKGDARQALEREIQRSLAESAARVPKIGPNVISPLPLKKGVNGTSKTFEIESILKALDKGSPEIDALVEKDKKLSFDEKKSAAFTAADNCLEKGDIWLALQMLDLRDKGGMPLNLSQIQEVSDKLGQMCDVLIKQKKFGEVYEVAEGLSDLSFSKEWQNNFILSMCSRLKEAGETGSILDRIMSFASISEEEKRKWKNGDLSKPGGGRSGGEVLGDSTSPEASDGET